MPVPDSIMNGTLTSVTINGSYVAPYTFYNQSSLSTIHTKQSLRFVDFGGFKNCTSIMLNSLGFSGLQWIGSEAFRGCTSLSGSLQLNSALYIGSAAFLDTNISEITIGKGMCVLVDTDAFPASLTTIKVPSSYVDAYKSYPVWKDLADKIVSK